MLHGLNGEIMPDTSGGQAIPQTIVVDDVTIETGGDGKIKVVDGFNGEGHITIQPYHASADDGTFALSIDTSKAHNILWAGTTTINNWCSYKVFLAKGTYDIRLLSNKSTNHGIYSAYLDADKVGEVDSYAASPVVNQQLTISDIVVTESKLYTLKFLQESKNASSTAYRMIINGLALYRTA